MTPQHPNELVTNSDPDQRKTGNTNKPVVSQPTIKAPRYSKRNAAILALLQHPSREKAAEAAGIHPVTLWRWMKDPAFDEEYREARREAFTQTTSRLQQSGSAAVTVLQRVMIDKDAPAGSRVRAAEAVLEQSRKSMEVDDLAARVARLEKAARNADASKTN